MPSPYVRKVALETGKPIEEVEKHWQESKDIAVETLGKVEKNFTNEDFNYAIGILKNKMGIHDNIRVKDFVDSDTSAKNYIETLISSQFNIGKIIPPVVKRDDYDPDNPLPNTDEKKEESLPPVINLSPSNAKKLLKCEDCGHRFMGREGDQCPECRGIRSKSLSEVKKQKEKVDNPEDTELDDSTIHTDSKGPEIDGGGAQHEKIDTRTEAEKKLDEANEKEFAFLGKPRETPKFNQTTGKVELPKNLLPKKEKMIKPEKPSKERIREILSQREEEDENEDVDTDSLKEFLQMINLDKENG